MATRIFQPTIYLDGFDITSDLSQFQLGFEREMPDSTNLSQNTRDATAGLRAVAMSGTGFYQAGESPDLIDKILFDRFGSQVLCTVDAEAAGDGGVGYTVDLFEPTYSPFESGIGEVHGFSVSGISAGLDPVRGTIMHDANETTTGTGTARQLGSVAAGESVYASLHVISAGGTSLDVVVESDDASGFASPTTQLTFTQVTSSVASEKLSKAGAITDDWWRVTWTLGASGPYEFIVLVGIQ